MPNVPVVTKEHEEMVTLTPQLWETCIYVPCGRKIIFSWQEMPETPARTLHNDLRERIRDGVPRQVMIDDFWLGLR